MTNQSKVYCVNHILIKLWEFQILISNHIVIKTRDRNYQIILKRDKTQEELRFVLQSMLIKEGNFTKITKDKCMK